jgi:NADPH:quinone reductase-like Zn-dependent oxidoreductase
MPRIVRFHSTGSADVLKLEDAPPEEPGKGEVRLNVKAIGLNRAEVLYREGRYLEQTKLPSRLGYEASGLVDAVGEGVTDFEVGDYVSTIPSFSQSQYGVYGEQAIVPATSLARVPSKLSHAEAASVWMQYLTAYGALVDIADLKKGQHVLITAASSSVGYASIQLVRDAGGIAIATTRTSVKRPDLLKAGANHVIVMNEGEVTARVDEITRGKGVEIIFDSVAGPGLTDLALSTAYEGTIFIYGALSLDSTPFPLRIALKKGLNIRGYTMFQITNDKERLERGKAYILSRLESGVFKPVVDRIFKLDDIVEAHEYMESNQQSGKIVVET